MTKLRSETPFYWQTFMYQQTFISKSTTGVVTYFYVGNLIIFTVFKLLQQC